MQRRVTWIILTEKILTTKNINPFDLNRTEYAELLGVSSNCIRMRLRHGKLEGEYIFENGKYLFRAPSRERVNIGTTTGQKTTLKKIYRRGNHYKANYPNDAFRKYNEAKMLAKLKYNVDEETQDLLPDALVLAKQKKRERLQSSMSQASGLNARVPSSEIKSYKNYGTGIYSESNKGYLDTVNPYQHQSNPQKFTATNRGRRINKKGPYEI